MIEKVDRQTAEQEFQVIADKLRLDFDTEGLDENEVRDREQDRIKIIKAIQKGYITTDEKGILTFHPSDGDPIVWFRPNGKALMAMDKKKKSADVGKMYASMAAMTSASFTTFEDMDIADMDICLSIWTLFLIR